MLKEEEEASPHKLTEFCEQYILLKLANEINSGTLTSLQMYYCLSYNVPTPKKSTILYYKVLDQTCDNKETLLSVINDLYTLSLYTLEGRLMLYLKEIKPHMRDCILSEQSMGMKHLG